MIWGHTGNEQSATGIASSVTSFVNKGYGFVLGFNEPDNTGQSNIPVATAISLWPSFNNPAIKIGTPGTAANANPGMAWFTNFMNMLNADTALRADFLAIHWYGWNAGSCNATAVGAGELHPLGRELRGQPPDLDHRVGLPEPERARRADGRDLLQRRRRRCSRSHPRLVRYAWYPWATNHALVDSGGALTALGPRSPRRPLPSDGAA